MKENFSKEKLTKIAVPSGSFSRKETLKKSNQDKAIQKGALIDGTKNLITRNSKTLKTFCNDERFVRLHKSYIVNLEHVIAFNKADGGSISLSEETSSVR